MNQSRVSQLLKGSRSRHQIIINPDLRKASWQWHSQKTKSRDVDKELTKITSEMRYFESLNKRLDKGLSYKKKDLSQVQSIRQRYMGDIRKKQKLQIIRQEQIRKNKSIADKIKDERNKRIMAVKKSIFLKESLADYSRQQKQRLRTKQEENQSTYLTRGRNRVEQIVQFQVNLRESYVRKKQQDNSKHLNQYRRAIDRTRRTMDLKKQKTQQIKKKLQSLTNGTARKMDEISQLTKSIRRYKPFTPTIHSPICFNKEKLIEKSRCYTYETNSNYQNSITKDNSLFLSQHNEI